MTAAPAPERERNDWWSLVAAIILSLATLASAWSGYQAARWGGETTRLNRAATVERFEATRMAAVADRQLTIDVLAFATWLEAWTVGDEVLASSFHDRFRPEFLPVFDAWFARSVDGEPPEGTPFDGDDYALETVRISGEHSARAEVHAAQADDASRTSDDFVLTAVLYASVLFLAGIASKVRGVRASHGAVALSASMFVVATAFMVGLPFRL